MLTMMYPQYMTSDLRLNPNYRYDGFRVSTYHEIDDVLTDGGTASLV